MPKPAPTRHITRAEWIAALRSGKYRPVKGILFHAGGHCCLGVACRLANVYMALNNRRTVDFCDVDAEFLYKDLGITPDQAAELANLNDAGRTFAEIANTIKALPHDRRTNNPLPTRK